MFCDRNFLQRKNWRRHVSSVGCIYLTYCKIHKYLIVLVKYMQGAPCGFQPVSCLIRLCEVNVSKSQAASANWFQPPHLWFPGSSLALGPGALWALLTLQSPQSSLLIAKDKRIPQLGGVPAPASPLEFALIREGKLQLVKQSSFEGNLVHKLDHLVKAKFHPTFGHCTSFVHVWEETRT